METSKVKHYIVKETGDPDVDRTDVVDRGWGELWMEFSTYHFIFTYEAHGNKPAPASVSLGPGSSCLRGGALYQNLFRGAAGVGRRSYFKTLDLSTVMSALPTIAYTQGRQWTGPRTGTGLQTR